MRLQLPFVVTLKSGDRLCAGADFVLVEVIVLAPAGVGERVLAVSTHVILEVTSRLHCKGLLQHMEGLGRQISRREHLALQQHQQPVEDRVSDLPRTLLLQQGIDEPAHRDARAVKERPLPGGIVEIRQLLVVAFRRLRLSLELIPVAVQPGQNVGQLLAAEAQALDQALCGLFLLLLLLLLLWCSNSIFQCPLKKIFCHVMQVHLHHRLAIATEAAGLPAIPAQASIATAAAGLPAIAAQARTMRGGPAASFGPNPAQASIATEADGLPAIPAQASTATAAAGLPAIAAQARTMRGGPAASFGPAQAVVAAATGLLLVSSRSSNPRRCTKHQDMYRQYQYTKFEASIS